MSQKGTSTQKGTRMREIRPRESTSWSRPVTPWSATMGVPSAPNATGAVLASSVRPAACSGRKPRLIRIDPQTATGVPKPEVPSKNAPSAKSNQQQLQPAVVGDVGEAFLQGDEAACFYRQVIEKDDGNDDPANWKCAVARAIACRSGRRLGLTTGRKTRMATASAVSRPARAAM